MDWPWEVAERDHELQNPTSPEKIRLLGDYLRLTPESRVLDLACGSAGPACLLAATFGCHVQGVELRAGFVARAEARIAAAGLEELVRVGQADAATVPLEPEAWDAVLCLGAAFVWGTIEDAAAAVAPAARRGGGVAVGEPYWRQWPPPPGIDAGDFVPLTGTVERFECSGLALIGLITASEDDWDRYESLHWRALEEWLAAEDDPAVRAEHAQHRRAHLERRTRLGWAILVGRKP